MQWICSICGKPTAKPWRRLGSTAWTCADCVASEPSTCSKYRFRTEVEADRARHDMEGRDGRLRRTYFCEPCGAWHVTSKPYRFWDHGDAA